MLRINKGGRSLGLFLTLFVFSLINSNVFFAQVNFPEERVAVWALIIPIPILFITLATLFYKNCFNTIIYKKLQLSEEHLSDLPPVFKLFDSLWLWVKATGQPTYHFYLLVCPIIGLFILPVIWLVAIGFFVFPPEALGWTFIWLIYTCLLLAFLYWFVPAFYFIASTISILFPMIPIAVFTAILLPVFPVFITVGMGMHPKSPISPVLEVLLNFLVVSTSLPLIGWIDWLILGFCVPPQLGKPAQLGLLNFIPFIGPFMYMRILALP